LLEIFSGSNIDCLTEPKNQKQSDAIEPHAGQNPVASVSIRNSCGHANTKAIFSVARTVDV